eukprot:10294840-Heterocapsa_arctica.AAC.1
MRDCTTRQNHDENDNRRNGIIYKQEKEEGTQITSINLSGSQFDFEFMLDHCKDHVMLIQEHWGLNEEVHSWKTLAHLKGWQGVWEPTKTTENNQDGITGRSGGVAILKWNGRLILKNTVESDYRA